jgi:hypothetical protein
MMNVRGAFQRFDKVHGVTEPALIQIRPVPDLSPISGVEDPSQEVTLAEIAATEHLLETIDRNNAVLAGVSQWLLVWSFVRSLALRVERSQAVVQTAVAGKFVELLRKTSLVGSQFMSSVRSIQVDPQHLRAFANCSEADLHACVATINDLAALHSQPRLSPAVVAEVWGKAA